MCVVETMREDFLHRYPERHAEDIVTIPNGFDPEDFEDLWAGKQGIGSIAERDGTLTILHTGHVYGPRRIEPLLGALSEWRRIDPELTASVRVRLVGGSSEQVENLRSTIEHYQLRACVAAEPEVSHREALRRQSQAAVLLLIGFSGPHGQYQMSGKIFEYLAIGRPILALAPPSCPVTPALTPGPGTAVSTRSTVRSAASGRSPSPAPPRTAGAASRSSPGSCKNCAPRWPGCGGRRRRAFRASGVKQAPPGSGVKAGSPANRVKRW